MCKQVSAAVLTGFPADPAETPPLERWTHAGFDARGDRKAGDIVGDTEESWSAMIGSEVLLRKTWIRAVQWRAAFPWVILGRAAFWHTPTAAAHRLRSQCSPVGPHAEFCVPAGFAEPRAQARLLHCHRTGTALSQMG